MTKRMARAWLVMVAVAFVGFCIVAAILEPATLLVWGICAFIYLTGRALYEAGL